MNKSDRSIFFAAVLLTSALMLYIARSLYGRYHPAIAEAIVLPISSADLVGDHPLYRGNAEARFTLVEFADYQCPACIGIYPSVTQKLEHFGDVKFVFHHYPLSMHPLAQPAAVAAEASRFQGKFWPMHDTLMSSNGRLSPSDIKDYALRLHLDLVQFERASRQLAFDAVKKDILLGNRIGINATPTFILLCPDGKVIRLTALSQLEQYVNAGSHSKL